MKQLGFRQIWILLVSVIVACCCGWYAHKWYSAQYGSIPQRLIHSKGYEFTSPLLDVELPEGMSIDREPHPFKHKIREFVENKIANKQAKSISVYYRDLHDGPWFAINHKKQFNPASLMKVPTMIAWLKRAEADPGILKRRIKYVEAKTPVPEQYTKPALTLNPGQSYSVDELLHYMMSYSDNRATSLLIKSLGGDELNKVIDSMDINYNPTEDGNSLTIHGYSGFFRILYNASYLNREMSEKALQLLSLQDFQAGIAAGVPHGIKIAAKFGEIVPKNNNQDIQLHEFGIVYHPKGHYILGVMTAGRNFDAQAEIIRDISKMVYSYVDSSIRN